MFVVGGFTAYEFVGKDAIVTDDAVVPVAAKVNGPPDAVPTYVFLAVLPVWSDGNVTTSSSVPVIDWPEDTGEAVVSPTPFVSVTTTK